MSPIYTYLATLGQRLSSASDAKALDYGCGAGELIAAARTFGLDCIGVDTFYEGGSYREDARAKGLLGSVIFELVDGRIPQPDQCFDVIFSNQVFEHIDDFELPLQEIHRVLKPGGVFINAFPTRDVWREGHCGIPFAHRFAKRSHFPRYFYVRALRALGLGYNTAGKSGATWSADILSWLDAWTFYKSKDSVLAQFSRYFEVNLFDADYFAFRLEQRPALRKVARLLRHRHLTPLAAFLAAKLSGHVFVLKKAA